MPLTCAFLSLAFLMPLKPIWVFVFVKEQQINLYNIARDLNNASHS